MACDKNPDTIFIVNGGPVRDAHGYKVKPLAVLKINLKTPAFVSTVILNNRSLKSNHLKVQEIRVHGEGKSSCQVTH